MDFPPLAIPLTAVFTGSNFCAATFPCASGLVLRADTSLSSLLAGCFRLDLVVFAHGSGFPFTNTTTHQTGAVGFANVHTFNKRKEHANVGSVEYTSNSRPASLDSSPGQTYQRP